MANIIALEPEYKHCKKCRCKIRLVRKRPTFSKPNLKPKGKEIDIEPNDLGRVILSPTGYYRLLKATEIEKRNSLKGKIKLEPTYIFHSETCAKKRR